jgi:hypothetical protein
MAANAAADERDQLACAGLDAAVADKPQAALRPVAGEGGRASLPDRSRRRPCAPASSGQTILHRLSRGGDRQLNRALLPVVLHRRQHDAATRDYIARRVAEGKTTREATRILKRYLARHLYRVMQNAEPAMT